MEAFETVLQYLQFSEDSYKKNSYKNLTEKKNISLFSLALKDRFKQPTSALISSLIVTRVQSLVVSFDLQLLQ